MEKLQSLLKIADKLDLSEIKKKLIQINNRLSQENAELILPLVGEFSSGKTTLLNALSDSKALETATKPTTATIFEVHFGSDKNYAVVNTKEGENIEVLDIKSLRNDNLAKANVVTVFDTSTKVPPTTILVDTPGLSSPDISHKQTLVDFLPNADAILLVTDINQQITRSLIDFVETMKLANCPVFLVITKCDTKSKSELSSVLEYISKNINLPLEHIAAVSASTDNLEEIYSLFNKIQENKNNIIKQIDDQRLNKISSELLEYIDDLLNNSSSVSEIEREVKAQEFELKELRRTIDKIIKTASLDIEDVELDAVSKFRSSISSKLFNIVTEKSPNYDIAAQSVVSNVKSIILNEYKRNLQSSLKQNILRKGIKSEHISFASLEDLDLSGIDLQYSDYALNLNSLGHKYDSMISGGLKVVAAAGAVAAVVATGGGAAGAMGTMTTIDTVADIADTVSDVASIRSNQNTVGRIAELTGKGINNVRMIGEAMPEIDQTNQMIGSNLGNDKGIVESVVSWVTDKTMGKPQRQRAIREYIDTSLYPEFKRSMFAIREQIVTHIENLLYKDNDMIISQKTQTLNDLKEKMLSDKQEFENKVKELKELKIIITK